MSQTAASRRFSRRSALALVFVPVAVFFLLSLIGGLIASGAGADDETAATYPPASVPDLDDPSAWTSCGDSCVEPVFACEPGYAVPDGASIQERCELTGKPVSTIPFDVIDCPGDDLVAVAVTLDDETMSEERYPSLDDLFDPFGPPEPYEYPLYDDIAFEEEAFAEEVPVVPTPTTTPLPTPLPALDPAAAPTVSPMSPPNFGFPYCESADGDQAPATVVYVLEPTNVEPQCPDGSSLWANQDGLFCRPSTGPDTEVLIGEAPPLNCEARYGEVLITDPNFDFDYCASPTSSQYPYCPNGFTLLGEYYYGDYYPYEPSETEPFCTNDDAVIEAYYAELEAAYEAHDAVKDAEYEVHRAAKDAEHNEFKAEYGIPDGDDLSAWESCGDNCYLPVFVCGPGFTAAQGSGAAELCFRDESMPEPPPDLDIIDCPGDDVVAVVQELTEDAFFSSFGSIDDQVCVPPTGDNLFGSTLECPAGYTLVDPFGPTEPFEYLIGDIDGPPVAIPVPVLMAPPPPRVVPTPSPAIGVPVPEFPYCVGPDDEEVPATSSYVLEPTNYRPGCPDGSDLYGSDNGLFCRPAEGPDTSVLAVVQAPVCSENEALVSDVVFESYQYCQLTVSQAFPYCPNGYFADAYYLDPGQLEGDVTCIGEDAFFAGFDSADSDTVAAREAALDEDYSSYPAAPNDDTDEAIYAGSGCPSFAILANGTCANVISGSAAAAPAPAAPPTYVAPAPTAVVGFVQQQPVVAPVIVAQAPVQAQIQTHQIAQAGTNYGFGSSLPTVTHAAKATTTSAKLAHTGSGTRTAVYIALSLIAGGAVAMGSRRRELDARI